MSDNVKESIREAISDKESTDNVKKSIREVISDEVCTIHLYLLLKKNGQYKLKVADVEDAAAPELKSLFVSNLDSTIVNNGNLSIRSLSKDDETNTALYLYDYEDYPDELSIFKEFKVEEAINSEKFNFEEDSLSDLFAFIIYIGTMNKGVTLFKKHYPIALIKRDSFLLGIKKSKHRFEKISGEDIIRLNNSWQLMNLKGQLYIFDLKVLEKNLGFTKLIKRTAEETIEAIKHLEIVGNIEALSDEIEDISFARKVARIQVSSAVFQKNVPSETIIDFSKSTPALSGQFKYSESGKQIILSTKKQKVALLRLLNDDFLHSELTAKYYTANSKDELGNK